MLASLLFAMAFFTTTTLGAVWCVATRTDVVTGLDLLLTPTTVVSVWTEPALLKLGLGVSLPLLLILFCHEMGHYLACRRYGLPTTLPYFLPAPVGLGTFGAFIRIRAPIANKKQLFDVGVSGPFAGFAALLPFLAYGLAHSRPAYLPVAESAEETLAVIFLPGQNLAMKLGGSFFHGNLPSGYVLDLHPFALAAWFGLLATAINLIPLGQLDGGHILYAVLGRGQRRLAIPLWIALGIAALFWRGWLIWCVLVLILGLRHPPVRDESIPLDRERALLALIALAILILAFTPVPIEVIPVTG